MKKKFIIVVVYAVYLLSLFIIASYYQYLDELPPAPGFFSGFGRSLQYARNFFLCCFFESWIFFVLLYFINRKLNIAFIFFVPFLLFLAGLVVYLASAFILWLSQLKPLISDFQKGFLITSTSSTIIMVWFFGDVFKSKEHRSKIYP